MVAHGPNPTTHHSDSHDSLSPHFSPLAKHRANPHLLRPGPCCFLGRLNLPRILSTRSALPISHKPNQNPPPNPKHNPPAYVNRGFRPRFARSYKLHPRLSSQLRHSRHSGRGRLDGLEFAYNAFDLHILLRHL